MTKRMLYVALDSTNQKENLKSAAELTKRVLHGNYGFKINLDSVANFSSGALSSHDMVKTILDYGKPVFVDMKMWNGGRTVESIATGCAELGVDIINMYPHAGKAFYERVLSALKGSNTKLFGLTVLTHYTDEDTQKLYGKNLRDAVRMFVEMNKEYGANGVILPGTALNDVKDINLSKLVPAVRPIWFADKKANSQEQTVAPEEAFENGANYVVCGSPIFKSPNPAEALERILTENNLS